MRDLQGKTAVVTGAGRGIGRATAVAFAEAGCCLALCDVAEEGLDETRTAIARRRPRCRIGSWRVDVADSEAMEGFAESVVEQFGTADVVVNNAGINVTARFENHTLERFRDVMDVNLGGVVHGCRSFLPYMRDGAGGHIVNISSAFGLVGAAGQTAYSASKFAVRGFSQALREELAEEDVDVSVVYPGCIGTAIVREAEIPDEEIAEKIRSYFDRFGTSPDVVAYRIVDAVRTGRQRVVVTPEAKLFDWLRRIVPTAGNRIANRLLARIVGIEPV